MENESFNQWQGALNKSFDQEIHDKSELTWENVEVILNRKKRKRRIFLWLFTIGVVAFTLGIFFCFKESFTSENNQIERSISTDDVKHFGMKNGVGELNDSNLSHRITQQSIGNEILGLDSEIETIDRRMVQNDIVKAEIISIDRKADLFDSLGYYSKGSLDKVDTLNQKERLPLAMSMICPKDWTVMARAPGFLNYVNEFKIPRFMRYISLQLGLSSGRSIRIVRGDYNEENINSKSLNSRRFLLPNRNMSVMCQWHFADRFWISSGVQWGGGRKRTRWIFRELTVESQDEQVQFKSAEGDVVTDDPQLINQIAQGQSGLYKLRMNYSYRMLSIPLGIGYRFSHHVIAPHIVGGLNCEIITNRQMSIDVGGGNSYRNIPLRFTQNTTKSNVQAFGAAGLSFRMSEKIEFQVDGAYYRPLHFLLNANGYQVQSARILLNCGVSMKL